MSKSHILIVEDDPAMSSVLEFNLHQEGYRVTVTHDGQEGLTRARADVPDLILLDVMLPRADGLEVCRALRSGRTTADIPVIMMTARGEELDQLTGYRVGADDYITKPFSIRILLERVRLMLRRTRTTDGSGRENSSSLSGDVISHAGLTIDRIRHRVTRDNQPLDLTPTEFRLLDTLIRQPGRVFDRTDLIDSALGVDTIVQDRTIDVHIRSLRKKLENAARLIETVRGVGYRFSESEVTSDT